jgi:hypothetical protein
VHHVVWYEPVITRSWIHHKIGKPQALRLNGIPSLTGAPKYNYHLLPHVLL